MINDEKNAEFPKIPVSTLKLAALYLIVSVLSGKYGVFACFSLCVPILLAGISENGRFVRFFLRLGLHSALGLIAFLLYIAVFPPFLMKFIFLKLLFTLVLAFFCFFLRKSQNEKFSRIFGYFSLFFVNFICFL